MWPATGILISEDCSLTGSVFGVFDRIPDLRPILYPRVEDALVEVERCHPCVALVHLPRDAGLDPIARWLGKVGSLMPAVATLVISDQYQAGQALSLLRLGAADYLSRPLDLNRLAFLLNTLSIRGRYARPEVKPVSGSGADIVRAGDGGEPFLYFASQKMGQLMEKVRRVASSEATILLEGETGTGKTRLARLIHEQSPRREEPFLEINCGALTETLIGSEMFGHVKGAFTGADRDHTGKFAEAGRGTLFLDEVDSLPLRLQAKLLRAVENRVFEPVGSNRTLSLRARLVVASNCQLGREAAAGRFRSDLYYRLNIVSFVLPPLRERREMIPELARTFAAEFAAKNGRPAPLIEAAVMHALEAHDWPGNIRELRNAIERAVVLCQSDRIRLDDLPEALARPVAAPDPLLPDDAVIPLRKHWKPTLQDAKEQAELIRIQEALDRHANNRLRAAAYLGISRVTLYRKLHKHGLIKAV